MKSERSVVSVVDDDVSIRDVLKGLFSSVGLNVATFASAQEFLGCPRPESGCLVLDVRLPDLSGFDLQRILIEANVQLPIIFMTGQGDIEMSVRAMKAGAVDFFTKPFRHQDLLDAVQQAIDCSREMQKQSAEIAEFRKRFESLTARQREVLNLVVRGFLNKQIAVTLGISEATVKLHRGHGMEKMGAQSLADLIRMAVKFARDS